MVVERGKDDVRLDQLELFIVQMRGEGQPRVGAADGWRGGRRHSLLIGMRGRRRVAVAVIEAKVDTVDNDRRDEHHDECDEQLVVAGGEKRTGACCAC